MARIVGVDIPENKRIEVALTYIKGVGLTRSQKILKATKTDFGKKTKDLTDEEINKIHQFIDRNYRIEGELRHEVQQNIRRLKDIGCYRGLRHIKNLPARGQRTRSNARQKKGKRMTVGGLKRKLEKK